MTETANNGRRQFLTGSAALASTAALGGCAVADIDRVRPAATNANVERYVLDTPPVVSMAVNGTTDRFPVRRVYCLGRNYRAHAIESGDDPNVTPPFFFMKPRDAVVDSRAGFPYPQATKALRYEAEMVVALKSGGKDIPVEDALGHVYAYGVGLDMTREDLQSNAQDLSRPWAISKSFDNSAPCGPLSRVATNGHATRGRIWLSVNGELKQDSDINRQRWSVAEGIAVLSQHYELMAGDLILTGTPEGIGLVIKGDVIRAGIDGLGEIEVPVS